MPSPQSQDADPGAVPPSVSDGADHLEALNYEQAREELSEVVRRLEAGGVSLEESLALWERGEALARRCQTWLDGARELLDAARQHGSGDEPSDGRGP